MRKFFGRAITMSMFRARRGFTIVELLVVIVVIGILAAVSIVAYSGISQKAVFASLQSDLSNASTQLKMFLVDNGNYPVTISTNCTTSPDTSTNKCLKVSNGNSFVGYSANNLASLKTYILIENNNSLAYKVTSDSAPTQLDPTTQPGVTPGIAFELHGAKANGGTGQGINSPLTTTWADTSGNNNSGSLLNFSGSPWAGVGTVGNPYNLTFSSASHRVSIPGFITVANKTFSYEAWFKTTDASATNRVLIGEDASGGAPLVALMLDSTHHATIYWWGPGWSNGGFIFGMNAGTVNNGAWHHAVAIGDGSRLRLYVDNVEQDDGTGQYGLASASAAGTNQTSVGAYGSGAYFPGSIAVTRVYPFTLTPAQITANYNAGPDW